MRRGGGREARSLCRKFIPLPSKEKQTLSQGCLENFAGMSWTPGNIQNVCAKNMRLFTLSAPGFEPP